MPCWQSLQTLCAQLFFHFFKFHGHQLWCLLGFGFAFAFALALPLPLPLAWEEKGRCRSTRKGQRWKKHSPRKTSNGGKKASRPANLLGGVGLEWLCCTQQLFQTPDTEHCVSAYRKTTRTQTYTGRQERTAYTSRRVGQGGRTEYLCLGLCLSGCVWVCVCARSLCLFVVGSHACCNQWECTWSVCQQGMLKHQP